MKPEYILFSFIAYTILIFIVTWITSRKSNNESYFIGNKASPWYVVAYGMIGASLSGVTFMSVPGWVGTTQFTYMMVIFGYFFGYAIIATVLLPLYYKLNLTSIYTYLNHRLGFWSYKTGALFFLISRTIGASFRMFLVINVLQVFVFEAWGVPFWLVVAIFIMLIILYTFEGGIKTIVWTDTLQTTFMLGGLVLIILSLTRELGFSLSEMIAKVIESDYSKILYTDWHDKRFFLKQFISGIFIAIVMTGLDQEMMQKNLSCRNLKEAQRNMFTFSSVLVFVNLLFLFMGAVMYFYAASKGIAVPQKTDNMLPMICFNYLGPVVGVIFMIGLISAAYPSADGALTSLTTSFCVDFLRIKERNDWSEKKKKQVRYIVHFSFAFLLMLVILIFKAINNEAVINSIFVAAGYTYGPLLGLFSFGLFSKRAVKDHFVLPIAIASPIICYILSINSKQWFGGYEFGFELLLLNGLLTFIGLLLISRKNEKVLTS